MVNTVLFISGSNYSTLIWFLNSRLGGKHKVLALLFIRSQVSAKSDLMSGVQAVVCYILTEMDSS